VPGPDIFAEDCENDLYAAIDLVTKKLEQQLRKRHSKFKARNHSTRGKEIRRASEA
jgi:putative sigma-54 modulation protein